MKNLEENQKVRELFKPLVEFYGINFQERCCDLLHDAMYQITQIDTNVQLNPDLQADLSMLNSLYLMFRNPLLKEIL